MDFGIARRKIISESNGILSKSKQAIFAMHRGNLADALNKIDEAKQGIKSLEKRFGKDGGLRREGSWKAAMEEFVEASLYYDFLKTGKLKQLNGVKIEADEYIGGLSDFTGEVLRKMVVWATEGDMKKVKNGQEAIAEVISELIELDLVSYLRTKFDQAKKNWQKSESIMYDLSLKNNKK